MADSPRKTVPGTAFEENIPEEMEHELSVGKRMWYVDRELDALKKELKEGNRSFASIRSRLEEQDRNHFVLQRELENKLEIIRRELEGKDLTNRREIETLVNAQRRELELLQSQELNKVTATVATLENTVAPRYTASAIIRWGITFAVPTLIAIGSYVVAAARYPTRDEYDKIEERMTVIYDKLDDRTRKIEQRLEVMTKELEYITTRKIP